ncbi:MAG: hypothetical protein K2M46_09195 [Lachnospiraceae bacterium]|nr:hypothetical protein [Lachnospiraceae bacterium]
MDETKDFDSKITTHTMKLLKTALPYVNTSEQHFLSIYLKFSEFLNTLQLYTQEKGSISACKSDEKKQGNMIEMVNALKKVCHDHERETLDMMLNFLQAMQLYQTYSEFYKTTEQFKELEGTNPFAENNQMDMLKAFLTPEQQTMFETYKSLF